MMSLTDVGLFSYLIAALAFLVLTALLVFSWRGRPLGRMVILASGCTAIWAALMFLYQIQEILISIQLIWLAEFARDASWCLLLLKFGRNAVPTSSDGVSKLKWVGQHYIELLLLAAFLAIFVLPLLSKIGAVGAAVAPDLALIAWVAIPVGGMLLIEQLYRGAGSAERWGLRYLCLGVGAIFAYDFFLYSDALLFKGVNKRLWEARGIVNSLSAPLIAISIARNPVYDIAIHVSRNMVFHSVTVLGAGIYLLAMAAIGYFIRFYGGTWGAVLQVVFFCGAVIFLCVIIFSDRIRAKTRVFLSKNFYSFKYDYREQWLRYTKALSETEDPVPERVIRSMASLVDSKGGLLWQRQKEKRFLLLARWQMLAPDHLQPESLLSLVNFLERTCWVVDIDEYKQNPNHYRELDLPAEILHIQNAWLIVPLIFKGEVNAFILLKRSPIRSDTNWEDRDLLKMAGQQAATYLAQYAADKALVEVRQFDAFNRLSAYIVHDLKNILAQQSLIVANAGKHRQKPEFIEDVIRTVENSVSRMTRLMEQLRSGVRGEKIEEIQVAELLENVIKKKSTIRPKPEIKVAIPLIVRADREQLANVLGHIVQNAQDATPKSGSVEVSLAKKGGRAILKVRDNGCGMDEGFIRSRLFKPFESTKGLTGMGIGLFESREYIHSIGGDISVESAPGIGTTFIISLPLLVLSDRELEVKSLEKSL